MWRCDIEKMDAKKAMEALKLEGGLEICGKMVRVTQFFEGLVVAEAALKKQIPVKPIKTEPEGYRHTDTYRCPACGRDFSGTGIADYCYHCGQALDWNTAEYADNDTAQDGLMSAT